MTQQSQEFNQQRTLSHGKKNETIEETIEKVKQRIIETGDKPHVTVARQLELLNELVGFPLGQFLLQNGGLNGYWTDYILEHQFQGRVTGIDTEGRSLTKFEKYFLDKTPTFLATQERYIYFGKIIQNYVQDDVVLASLPCGVMRDLLKLDFTGVENFRLVGIDIDYESLELAKKLAEEYDLSEKVEFHQEDAWNLPFEDEFTLLTSNGLNVYEPDDEKVTELYRQFFKALIPGGILVTSFVTIPPNIDPNSEWNMSQLNQDDLLLLKIVFGDIILSQKVTGFRSSLTTKLQLQTVGFDEIELIRDNANICPTVVARKPKK
ncbi:MAG: class I SAM-dependent methyltransferase [Okeania sp. SIO2G4]|uniref:class I SAM-dependent methyltransferase n=1 Tax=unclassified Okeania TaxID=2634635 RepID=UPI0013BB932E|nr:MULTISPECIES: class I SAM-dependent methyltransferase [unclassified Okeania]NEP71979.1 class I SAM-dependent methyltransferase [Okeania sp. SIO2G5]NEP95199.1 class I SAM-dependent methyltransferase [Okeania sp. SIO2F5]NEQ91132.1 class I SAM-dependent methyltransferase [Okeania sp. SIO2G4]